MDKDIFELIVKRLTNCNDKTKQVMDIVFPSVKLEKLYLNNSYKMCEDGHLYKKELNSCPYCTEVVFGTVKVEVPENKSKKDEIIDSLVYLKSKDVKTKKDNESIYMLEMILKNLK